MRNLLLVIALAITPQNAAAQQTSTIETRLQRLEDESSIRELVGRFALLAGHKDTDAQADLFTPDAVFEQYLDDDLVGSFNGKEAIAEALGVWRISPENVYYSNGQHLVEVRGDSARGVLDSTIIIVETRNGERVSSLAGIVFEDEYIRQEGGWLIARRTARYTWQ